MYITARSPLGSMPEMGTEEIIIGALSLSLSLSLFLLCIIIIYIYIYIYIYVYHCPVAPRQHAGDGHRGNNNRCSLSLSLSLSFCYVLLLYIYIYIIYIYIYIYQGHPSQEIRNPTRPAAHVASKHRGSHIRHRIAWQNRSRCWKATRVAAEGHRSWLGISNMPLPNLIRRQAKWLGSEALTKAVTSSPRCRCLAHRRATHIVCPPVTASHRYRFRLTHYDKKLVALAPPLRDRRAPPPSFLPPPHGSIYYIYIQSKGPILVFRGSSRKRIFSKHY
jgi:hypothetical protein